jgi:hypothetical protein
MNKPKTSADVCKSLADQYIVTDLFIEDCGEYVKKLVHVHHVHNHNGTLSGSSYYQLRFENPRTLYYSTSYHLIDEAKKAWDIVSLNTPHLIYRVTP